MSQPSDRDQGTSTDVPPKDPNPFRIPLKVRSDNVVMHPSEEEAEDI